LPLKLPAPSEERTGVAEMLTRRYETFGID
jgi:hypothetical protein